MPKLVKSRMSIDTETTGVDVHHGAAPYLVTTCNQEWETTYWEWDVDPLTRKVLVQPGDVEEIIALIESADELSMQNGKFDVGALTPILPRGFTWPWKKCRDTVIGGHLLASNHPHNLTDMCIEFLSIDITKYEQRVKEAVTYVRRFIQRKGSPIGDWRIAKEGLPEMPSAKASPDKKKEAEAAWKFDMWLPRAFGKWCIENDCWDYMPYEEGLETPKDHSFFHVTAAYANTDSSTTLALDQRQEKLIEQRGLTPLYNERMRLVPITFGMEQRGVTLNKTRLEEKRAQFIEDSQAANRVCVNIAKSCDYELELPKSGNNGSLIDFAFNHFKLPVVVYTEKGNPSLNKDAIEIYQLTLPPRSKELLFINRLSGKRKCDTAISYMNGYEKFWIPLGMFNDRGEQLWYTIHPSLNITGTATLRWSSSNPNEQNISKKEDYNIRECFGPAPGREWWSLDAKNIELRIPAYESGQRELIDLFEKPNDPPYYGSTHLLNFHTVYDDIWEMELREVPLEKVGPHCKKKYAATWYQYVKNGGFAVQYGAMEESGTADRAFHRPGSQAKLKARFDKLEALNQKYIEFANKHGYVETIPDRSVSDRGYPLLCTRSDYGKIVPTVPLNYHVQSTAMWWTARGMVRCQELLDCWRETEGFDGFMAIQCHDELLFDVPKGNSGDEPWSENLPKVMELAKAMEKGGEGIGIPTPVGIEYHGVSWAEGKTLK